VNDNGNDAGNDHRWYNKQFGPAAIGTAAIMITLIGVIYTFGGSQAELKAGVIEIKAVVQGLQRESDLKTRSISDLDSRTSKVETALTFIVPSLARIEGKLNDRKP